MYKATCPYPAKRRQASHSRWQGGRIRLLSDWGPRLFRKVLRGKVALAEPLVDLLGLPLAFEVFALVILLLFRSTLTHVYVLAAFCIILLHVGIAIQASTSPKHSLGALLHVPIYLVTRLTKLTSAIRASDKSSAWGKDHYATRHRKLSGTKY